MQKVDYDESSPNKRKLRIHGDNILECETALNFLRAALDPISRNIALVGGTAFSPVYQIKSDTGIIFDIQLFPGYGRWGFDIKDYLSKKGAVLREATDAVITNLVCVEGDSYEELILSLEFCGALPAGNNAWQRCGRALASAYAKVPYLYFAEIGGVELDANREVKAARFPNPLIPFAYLTLGKVENSISVPVFTPSPSLNEKNRKIFNEMFGSQESILLIRNLLLDEPMDESLKSLYEKAEKVVEILANERKRNDILLPHEWRELSQQKTGGNKAEWLIKKGMSWNKKIGLKGLNKSFLKLLDLTIKQGAAAVGAKEMPICLLEGLKREQYAKKLEKLYGKKINKHFLDWLRNKSKPLVCVWIAGFKPRGDDSRPDRGLVPLARMVFGRKDVDFLTIVYGPAKKETWERLESDLYSLPKINGLWEAIIGLSDGLLIDSPTGKGMANIGYLISRDDSVDPDILLRASNTKPSFGEHDVDSVLHLLFSDSISEGVYEGLCNPPGGDWSGISIFNFEQNKEYRWTSLPRVSGVDTKRPDHLIQFKYNDLLLSIESKNQDSALDDNIGTCLKNYVSQLINFIPISYRKHGEQNWGQLDHEFGCKMKIISGGAFNLTDDKSLEKTLRRGKLDVVFGVDFRKEEKVVIRILINKQHSQIKTIFQKLASRLENIIEIQISEA